MSQPNVIEAARKLHGLVESLAIRFKGTLPVNLAPQDLADVAFIEDTIKKADAAFLTAQMPQKGE